MVPKRGEGGTLTGGVSGSSSVMTLLVGSKKWTLVGVVGAIVMVRVVKEEGRDAEGSGGRGGRWYRTEGGVLKNPGSFGTGYIYGRQTGIKGSKINVGCRTSGREKTNKVR